LSPIKKDQTEQSQKAILPAMIHHQKSNSKKFITNEPQQCEKDSDRGLQNQAMNAFAAPNGMT